MQGTATFDETVSSSLIIIIIIIYFLVLLCGDGWFSLPD